MMHTQNIPRQKVPRQNVPVTKKTSKGTKHPKGQYVPGKNVPRDKTYQGDK